MTGDFGRYVFGYISAIRPERDGSGNVCEFLPQARYGKARIVPLHKHGRGPFCRFRIPPHFRVEGVYVLCIDGAVHYVGECVNLSSRFNMGYGQISPRNCYDHGQPTNCKINHFILEATRRGNEVDLWFLQTRNRKLVESELITRFKPPWNDQGVS